jgi:glycerol uptake facilitator-like aquaporin
MGADLPRRLTVEAIGTAILLATVVDSGVMAFKLSQGNGAIALLCNTLPTGAILTVLILVFGPVSGAHLNPVVTGAFAFRREITPSEASMYVLAQIVGGILGVWAAHVMFELPIWQFSTTVRTGFGQWFAEAVAAFGLVVTLVPRLMRSAFTLRLRIGSPPLHRSLIPPSLSLALCPIRLPG